MSESTELRWGSAGDTVAYVSRVRLANPGPARSLALFMEFRDATGGNGDEGPPSFEIRVDDHRIETRVETDGDLRRFHWQYEAAAHKAQELTISAAFLWTEFDCRNPPYNLEWQTIADSTFDLTAAHREVVFRFDPEVSVLAIAAEEGEFERGVLRLPAPRYGVYELGFEPSLADRHLDEFRGRYSMPLGRELQYLEIGDRDCEIGDLDMAENEGDSMTVAARIEVEQMRSSARESLEAISHSHGLAALDTASTLEVIRDQPALRDPALLGLNSVERWDLRYAAALLWALDVRLKPSQIERRMEAAGDSAGDP